MLFGMRKKIEVSFLVLKMHELTLAVSAETYNKNIHFANAVFSVRYMKLFVPTNRPTIEFFASLCSLLLDVFHQPN